MDENQKKSFKSAGIELGVEIKGQGITPLREIAEELRKSNKVDIGKNKYGWTISVSFNNETKTYVIKFPEKTVVIHPTTGKRANISELEFSVRERVITEKVHIDQENYVSWIMTAIFEEKIFAISPEHIPTRWE